MYCVGISVLHLQRSNKQGPYIKGMNAIFHSLSLIIIYRYEPSRCICRFLKYYVKYVHQIHSVHANAGDITRGFFYGSSGCGVSSLVIQNPIQCLTEVFQRIF